MFRKVLLALGLLLLVCSTSFAQNSTTVSGTITDGGGQAWLNGTFNFVFVPSATNPVGPYVWGGGTLPTNIGGSLSGTGTYSVSIPSNTAISPIQTTWTATFCPQASSPCFTVSNITITGATQTLNATPPTILINLQSAQPPVLAYTNSEISGAALGSQYFNLVSGTLQTCTAISGNNCTTWSSAGTATNATNLVGPGAITGSFSGTHTETGNVTFTGTVQCKDFEGIKCVDNANSQGWAGADACAWITSAQSALPTSGGTILAYGLSQTCAGGFTIGSSTKPVSLYLFGLTNLTVNASLILGGQSSHIYGLSGMGASGATTILQGASFPASTPVIQIGTSVLITLATVEGVLVNCQDRTNSIAFEALFAADQSGFMNDVAQNFTKYGFWYEGTGGTGNVQLAIGGNLWALTSTAVGTANSYYFHNGNNIRLTGLTGASNATTAEANQFVFDGGSYRATDLHVEWGTQGVQIGPVAATIIELDNITGSANVPTMVKIENIAGNRATLRHLIANGSATTLTDALVSGLSITDTFIPEYDVWNTSAYWRKANGATSVIGTAAQILGPDGSLGAPGFAFNSQTNQNTGWSKPANNYWKFSSNGLDSLTLGPSGPFLGNIGVYAMNTGDSFSGTTDTGLSRVAAGIVGVGNGTNGSFAGSIKLTGLTVAGTLLPNTVGGTDVGSTALPFGNLWLGTAATNNYKFQPGATAAARTISIVDPLGNTNLVLTPAAGTVRSSLHISDQGTACANGNIVLSAGWGTTATTTAAAGQGQTCQFTLTSSGTGQAATPTITDTLPTALPSASVVCTAQMVGGTGANTLINQTSLSATAPVFTFGGTPVAASTYFVVVRCGP